MDKYNLLPSEDSREDVEDLTLPELHRCQHGRKVACKRLGLILLFLCTHFAAFWLGHMLPLTQLEHLKAITTWSPLHDDFPFELHLDHLNATTWTDNPSIWRAEPSPEGDRLWEQSWKSHPMLIPVKDMRKLNQDPTYVARWLDDPEMALVGSQAHHLLHCVDVLRQAVWSDHYWPKGNLNPGHRTHQTHCVDLLRQEIMCRAPLGVFPLIWMEAESQPTPNFNISLQCSNWDSMWSWWQERQMTDDQVSRVWVKPPGVKQWPAPNALKQENAALVEICSRPNINCTVDGEKLRPELIEQQS